MVRIILLFIMAILSSTSLCSATAAECGAEEDRTNITVSVLKNTTGEWYSSFIAERSIGEKTERVDLNLQYAIVRCGSDRIVQIKGTMRDSTDASHTDETIHETTEQVLAKSTTELPKINGVTDVLKFDEKKGKFAVLEDDGRTAYRKDPSLEWSYATLVTNRPLKEEELFEVVVEKTIPKWRTGSSIIGVTVSPPDDIENILWSGNNKNEGWILWFNEVHHDGIKINENYGINLNSLKIGDRLGAKVKTNGDLHFFLNGKDMGLAASEVPTSVYGIVDVRDFIEQISIVS